MTGPQSLSAKLLAKHKLLYNGDCNLFFYQDGLYDKRGLPRSIHTFINLIARNGVDTFLCNPNGSIARYPSKVVATNLDGYQRGDMKRFKVADPIPQTGHAAEYLVAMTDRYLDLVEKKIDWLREVTKACQTNRIAPWLSIRMNDMHGWADLNHHHHNNPILKNPKMRLSGRSFFPGRKFDPPWANGMNYGRKEVRDYMFSMIRELVEAYDFEGIELDYTRAPHILEPVANDAGTRLMTDWIASIRALTASKSKQTGKPYPLGLRTPVNLTLMKEKGLDIKTLAQEHIIDFSSFDHFLQTSWDTPFDSLRDDLGDLTLYGGIEMQPSGLGVYDRKTKMVFKRQMSSFAPLLYGGAACKYALKADGLELFNFFCGDTPTHIGEYKALRNLASVERLRGREKNYALNTNDGSTVSALPCIIPSGRRHDFRLPMLSEPARWKAEVVIQVIYEKKTANELIGVGFNGSHPNFVSVISDCYFYKGSTYAHDERQPPKSDLTLLQPEHQSRLFYFNSDLIREGWNSVEVYYGDWENPGPNCLVMVGLEMAVKKVSGQSKAVPKSVKVKRRQKIAHLG